MRTVLSGFVVNGLLDCDTDIINFEWSAGSHSPKTCTVFVFRQFQILIRLLETKAPPTKTACISTWWRQLGCMKSPTRDLVSVCSTETSEREASGPVERPSVPVQRTALLFRSEVIAQWRCQDVARMWRKVVSHHAVYAPPAYTQSQRRIVQKTSTNSSEQPFWVTHEIVFKPHSLCSFLRSFNWKSPIPEFWLRISRHA